MGTQRVISDFEIINKELRPNKDDKSDPKNEDDRWANNPTNNLTRNNATWWGVNSWGVNTKEKGAFTTVTDDYVLPLAYIFILSLGFDNINKKHMSLGHYYPNDGSKFEEQSPFSVFSYHSGIFDMPRSFVLLIGAILWRAREGGVLKWDEINPTVGGQFDGWNVHDDAVGIDDLGDPVWFFHNCISKPWQIGGAVFTNNRGEESSSTKNDVWDGAWLRQYFGEKKEFGNYVDGWTESAGPEGFQDSKQKTKKSAYLIGNYEYIDGLAQYNLHSTAQGISAPFDEPILYESYEEQTTAEYRGWLKTHGGSLNYQYNSWEEWKDTAINRGMFDQCRQDQIPFLAPQFSTATTLSNGGREYFDPATLVITNVQENTKRKAYFGVPSPAASVTAGYNTQAPNRDAENGYIKLKEHCKELMFLPRLLKKDFIDYFVKWAKDEYKKKPASDDSVQYLNTLDPLNWSPNFGLGNSDATLKDLYTKSTQVGNSGWKSPTWSPIPGVNYGRYGFIDPAYITDTVLKVKGGWFYPGDEYYKNIWFQVYSTDSNVLRFKKAPQPPPSNSRYNTQPLK